MALLLRALLAGGAEPDGRGAPARTAAEAREEGLRRSHASGDSVRIERILHAPPDRVFRAFLEPDLVRRWIVPDELDIERIRVDPRVDGRIEVWHSRDGESSGRFEGRFVKIDPPRELVYRWAFVGTEPEKGEYFDTLVRVQLRAWRHDQTQIIVRHERLAQLRRGAPHILPRLLPGWENCLEKLGRAAAEAPPAQG